MDLRGSCRKTELFSAYRLNSNRHKKKGGSHGTASYFKYFFYAHKSHSTSEATAVVISVKGTPTLSQPENFIG